MNKLESRIKERGAPLVGMAVHSYNPTFVEMMGLMGFDVAWIEMEHAPLTFFEALNLCRVGSGVGLLTMIRIPDARRENVLKAAECGPDIIDLPMGNDPQQLRDLVLHSRYGPQGDRGFFGASRAVRYGIGNCLTDERDNVNQSLCLISQIETRRAVERADELCAVPGLDGIFIGPGDLSASLGVPGDVDNALVRESIERVITVAREHGKIVAIAGGHPEAQARADIVFLGSDVASMRLGAQNTLKAFRDKFPQKT